MKRSRRTHVLEVEGRFACFTNPLTKVERISYAAPTPSSMRGVMDCIYWKPTDSFFWQVERIEILRPVDYMSLRRNEVKSKTKLTLKPTVASEERTQRQTILLKNVKYRVHARATAVSSSCNFGKIDDMFERYAVRGACYRQPYLGCREFVADFSYGSSGEIALPDYSEDLGWMLYDRYDLLETPHASQRRSLYQATVKDGVIEVPPYESSLVVKE